MFFLKKWIGTVFNFLDRLEFLSPLLARVVIGLVFAVSGWGKLHHTEKVIEFFTSLGIPAPVFQAYLVAWTELVCGLLVLIGLGTRLASIPLAITMVVALLTALKENIHEAYDLLSVSEFLYIIFLLMLVFRGAGRFSIDYGLRKKYLL